MSPSCGDAGGLLVGRSDVIGRLTAALDGRRSVLVVGPHGSGKSAVIDAVRRDDVFVVDPFAGITTPRASALRRALDRGIVIVGAAPSLDRAVLGHVGRIAWRFERIYLRPLPSRVTGQIIRHVLAGEAGGTGPAVTERWLSQAAKAAAGLPGRAVALAVAAGRRWRESRVLLPPSLALVIGIQTEFARSCLDGRLTTGRRPGELSS